MKILCYFKYLSSRWLLSYIAIFFVLFISVSIEYENNVIYQKSPFGSPWLSIFFSLFYVCENFPVYLIMFWRRFSKIEAICEAIVFFFISCFLTEIDPYDYRYIQEYYTYNSISEYFSWKFICRFSEFFSILFMIIICEIYFLIKNRSKAFVSKKQKWK